MNMNTDSHTSKITDIVSCLLDSNQFNEALALTSAEEHQMAFKDKSWDLIPLIISKINEDTYILKPSLFVTCEKLLLAISTKANPEEALLEFIEQIEAARNDSQFIIILAPLQNTLQRVMSKRGSPFEWCLNAISTYLEKIPLPEYELEEKERLLLDCDSTIRRIPKLYNEVSTFYKHFIQEYVDGKNFTERNKKALIAFLVGLLGKPLIYIDMDPENNELSEARKCCKDILSDLFKLEKNFIKLISYLEPKSQPASKKNQNDEEIDIYMNEDKMTLTSLSGLSYCIFSNQFLIPDGSVPQVYSIEYILHTNLLAVIHLLSSTDYGSLLKGIALCRGLFGRICYPTSEKILSSAIHFELSKKLIHLSIFCVYETIRKEAVTLISVYVNKFEFGGRCILLKSLLAVANHSGMIGYAITLYKNSLNDAFTCDIFPDCFKGNSFKNVLKKICDLPNGAESDLLELADQVITALNFIRYLLIKDVKNLTGIKEFLPYIEDHYLPALRTGLQMSKAHYEVKLKDIQEGKSDPLSSVNIDVNVGGQILDKIPRDKQQEIVLSALNAFHLMEGLMARVGECIDMYKSKS